MKKNRNISTSLAKRKISWPCLLVWIFGFADYGAAADFDDKKPDDNYSIKLWKRQEKSTIGIELSIPPAAQGYEDIYRKFLNGVLIYRPNKKTMLG